MKLYAPDYYSSFRCIADRCTHTCCVGWEIDIDDDTLRAYQTADGKMGERLARSIESNGETAHFILSGEDERCPFLGDSGLCDIITEMGEDALCRICADHPRFRSFLDSRTEIGLGLCCEEACRIILTWPERPEMVLLEDDGEGSDSGADDAFLAQRSRAIDLIFDSGRPLGHRCSDMLALFGSELPSLSPASIFALYRNLEYMENELPRRMGQLTDESVISMDDIFRGSENAAARLIAYFLFRHLADGMYDGTLAPRAFFAVVSTAAVGLLARADGAPDIGRIMDTARMYSAEIEYSDENVDALLEAFGV